MKHTLRRSDVTVSVEDVRYQMPAPWRQTRTAACEVNTLTTRMRRRVQDCDRSHRPIRDARAVPDRTRGIDVFGTLREI